MWLSQQSERCESRTNREKVTTSRGGFAMSRGIRSPKRDRQGPDPVQPGKLKECSASEARDIVEPRFANVLVLGRSTEKETQ
jgi:hypothetical protein